MADPAPITNSFITHQRVRQINRWLHLGFIFFRVHFATPFLPGHEDKFLYISHARANAVFFSLFSVFRVGLSFIDTVLGDALFVETILCEARLCPVRFRIHRGLPTWILIRGSTECFRQSKPRPDNRNHMNGYRERKF